MPLERPKISNAMWESLKLHIIRERQRKKEGKYVVKVGFIWKKFQCTTLHLEYTFVPIKRVGYTISVPLLVQKAKKDPQTGRFSTPHHVRARPRCPRVGSSF